MLRIFRFVSTGSQNQILSAKEQFIFPTRVHKTKQFSTFKTDCTHLKSEYDVVIIGAGHNGLISSCYLQKAGFNVCVLERRGVVGGAAVTEEIIPGFKFSRASYLLSLLRPFIIQDLKLKEHGLKFYMREPYSSYTPISECLWPNFPEKSLLLSSNDKLNVREISKFSERDALAYLEYERKMSKYVSALQSILDSRPPNLARKPNSKNWLDTLRSIWPMLKASKQIGLGVAEFHEVFTSSANKILNRWFESEPLKATLATDALIGTMSGPNSPGSGYVLLHHIMGGINETAGAWVYPEGGMGAVSTAIAKSAASLGVSIFTDQEIQEIRYKTENEISRTTGVVTKDGKEICAKLAVFSSATPEVTFKQLTKEQNRMALFGEDFMRSINSIDYTSPVTKINVAVSRLPNFSADPCPAPNMVHHPHKCTIHLNCESISRLENSFSTCQTLNQASTRPMIELVIPSSLDPTLAPEGAHVCLLFTQYTPYSPANGSWEDESFKELYASTVFDIVEEYAPGFKSSVVGKEVLTPVDLEKIFGLTGGNIFHGAMTVDQLYWLRPIWTDKCWFPETPVRGLFLCGSAAHPGGGVMGTPGYLAAKAFLSSSKI